MILTKKKFFIAIVISLLFVLGMLSFSGCKKSDPYCYLLCEDEITLMMNTNSSSADVKLITNTQYEISWDNEIIDYDINLGKVTAKQSGKTKISLSFYKNKQRYSQSVSIIVKNAVFATDLSVKSSYTLFMGSEKNKLSADVSTLSGEEYNLGFSYDVLDENILTSSGDNLMPVREGSTQVVIKAVSGYNEETKEFMYISRTSEVFVEKQVTDLELELYDSEKVVLSPVENVYSLFNGTKNDETILYYLKLRSTARISHYTILKANENQLWTDDTGISKEVVDDYTVFLPIKPEKFGESMLSIVLANSNGDSVFVSSPLRIHVYSYLQDSNIFVGSPISYKNKTECKSVSKDELTNFEQDVNTGKYILYKINNQVGFYDLAITNKNYFYGLIFFDNYDANCYNSVSAIAENLTISQISDNIFWFETQEVGDAKIEIEATAIDQSVFKRTYYYYAHNVVLQNYVAVESGNMNIILGDELDFSIANLSPAYATYSCELVEIENNNVLEINGFCATAKNVGTARLELRVDNTTFYYTVTVSDGTSIDITVESLEFDGENYLAILFVSDFEEYFTGLLVLEDGQVEYNRIGKRFYITSGKSFSNIMLYFDYQSETILKQVLIDWSNT